LREGKGSTGGGGNGGDIESLFAGYKEAADKAAALLEQAKADTAGKLEQKRAALVAEKRQLTADLDAQIDVIDGHLSELTGKAAKRSSGGTGTGTRTRRSAEQLQADAAAIVAYLEKHPGSLAADIRKNATGFTGTLGAFLEKFGKRKVKTEGPKNATLYTLA
jgi:hypothetical protein